ncbi:MAG: DUF4279 domain-containing protein [Thermosynechococcaceae cyanobacterium]
MENKYEISVRYSIDEFRFDPDEITSITGIQPSKIRRAGEPVSWAHKIRPGNPIPTIKYNSWEIKSELKPLTDCDEHIRVLIHRLRPSWSTFVELNTQYCGTFTCVIWDYSCARPTILLDQDILKDLAALNVTININVHSLNHEKQSSTSLYTI